jgi:hypothetical protein
MSNKELKSVNAIVKPILELVVGEVISKREAVTLIKRYALKESADKISVDGWTDIITQAIEERFPDYEEPKHLFQWAE